MKPKLLIVEENPALQPGIVAELQKAMSVNRPLESQSGCGAFAVAGGSLPASSADIEDVAGALEMLANHAESEAKHHGQIKAFRWIGATRHCANLLRRHAEYVRRQMEHSTERQPEENNKIS